MENPLTRTLEYVTDKYRSIAEPGGRHYMIVDIGKTARKLGFESLYDQYADLGEVVVSLKEPLPGMKVRIDGRTFVNYAEYENGFAVPEYIARRAGVPFTPYRANDSMICNFV